ncbi:aminopeptidase P family protein [Catenulispora pinisilvae]|uniref:aminopeptidase P family protein n=1 Tax=Catenulispora pinisilvae TaxID=2705253 RepID=UPI00189267E1|nr:aminopeptidase P family protein [Catenulispora pinisilvae]
MSSDPNLSKFATGSHDLPVTDALAAFMATQWAPSPLPDPGPVPASRWTGRRREAVSARFPGERLIVPAGVEKLRSNDTYWHYRPHSAFAHLTGSQLLEAVLVFEPNGSGHDAILFAHDRSSRDNGEAFRDRRLGEMWEGRRPSLSESSELYGITTENLNRLSDKLSGAAIPTRVLRGSDPRVDALVTARPEADAEFTAHLSELRLVKDAWELEQLQAAVDATTLGFQDVARILPTVAGRPRGERWVEGTFNTRARIEGNDVGYNTIVGGGAHACVLHWTANNGTLHPGDLLLLDAGVEVDTLYTADITRTLPISGTFTPLQRDLYNLVLQAQNAGIATLRPGARFRDFHWAAMRTIATGLIDMGLLKVSLEEAMDPTIGIYRRYTLCGSGHMLGLDVHDCAKARADEYVEGTLTTGNVLTVEPGLYLQPDDLTLPPELRGIGIRIEDDLVITEQGALLMSAALPREPDEVESWMAAQAR